MLLRRGVVIVVVLIIILHRFQGIKLEYEVINSLNIYCHILSSYYVMGPVNSHLNF